MSKLAEQVRQMDRRGGYVLAFARRIASQHPELTWQQFRRVLVGNCALAFCGYGEEVVRRNFEMGRA